MPLNEEPIDLLVVGAGPAGSRAAAIAAKEKVRTVLIDAKPRIGEQPHCGEFVPARLFTEFALDKASIIQSVSLMETRILSSYELTEQATPSQEQEFGTNCSSARPDTIETYVSSTIPSIGFLVDRVRFDRDLCREAAGLGVTVFCSTRLLRRENENWVVKCGSEETILRPKYIIAADGAISTVARSLGLRSHELLTGLQVEVPLIDSLDRTFVFLHRSFVGGYGWLFPKGKAANVGIGVVRGKEIHPKRILIKFLESLLRQRMIRPGRLAISGGQIPVSGLRETLVKGNVIFCGDSAGLTHPITGSGIPQAVASGDLAGRAVALAIKTGSTQHLSDYNREIRTGYAGIIGHALSKRTVMMRRWNDPDFAATCKNSWIAFKGYRKRFKVTDEET